MPGGEDRPEAPPAGRDVRARTGGGAISFWRLYPEHGVYIDGHTDLYGDSFIETYLETYRVRIGWEEPLDRHGVAWILVDTGSPLATLLAEHSHWTRAYGDDVSRILVRPAGP